MIFCNAVKCILKTTKINAGKLLSVTNLLARHGSSNIEVPEFEFEGNWPEDIKLKFIQDLHVHNDFISLSEEKQLLEEVEPYLKRMKYEKDHWDSAIKNFRETERRQWSTHNKDTIKKVIDVAFESANTTLPHIHVLDLAADGVILPHIDSVRYCGSTISGLSLLSGCVMKLVQSLGDNNSTDDYRNQPNAQEQDLDLYSVKVLLNRRSLYIMSESSRFNFTHEILKNDKSFFKGEKVQKDRRISIICRNEPNKELFKSL